MRCGEIVTYHKRNNFSAHIKLWVGSEYQNALCSANNATKVETAANRRLGIYTGNIFWILEEVNDLNNISMAK